MINLRLCESKRIILKPNTEYVFSVDPDCDECKRLAARANERQPTSSDIALFNADDSLTAILLVYSAQFAIGERIFSGRVFFDRKKRFEDGFHIYTSSAHAFDFMTRKLFTKNSIYLLTRGELA